VAAFVLRKPPATEREAIHANIETSMKSLDTLLAGTMDKAMLSLHAKPQRPKPPRPPRPEGAASATTQAAASPSSLAPETPPTL
jgi:PTH1 family peptidyl-tRNA hydrolase